MKITFMGAGSTVFARNVIGDCMCTEALRDGVFALYDIDGERLHQSYTMVKPYAQYDDGEYAEFSVDVEPNNEFYGRIFQMGAGLEIISPDSVRGEIAQRVHNLADLYSKKE